MIRDSKNGINYPTDYIEDIVNLPYSVYKIEFYVTILTLNLTYNSLLLITYLLQFNTYQEKILNNGTVYKMFVNFCRKEINKDYHISSTAFRNSFMLLADSKLLLRVNRGSYYINPFLVGYKGQYELRRVRIKEMIEQGLVPKEYLKD